MSAITGIFYRNETKVNLKQIQKMNKMLSHRGPDGSSIWKDGSVAFGHQMLCTTPESLHEIVPFHDNKLGLVITADARIDNRKELSEELNIEDKEYTSDNYFILKSYEKWGENCPEHLIGDFAFAIWDENLERLFCARDHVGVKPFYYYLSHDLFIFGTEIKALLCFQNVSCEINYLMATFHLMNITDETTQTFYKDILRLPAAHSMIIDQSGASIKKYWKLDPELKISMDSDEEYKNKFLQIFNESVNCRLRSAFPLGIELSGGLDSSSILGIVKKNIIDSKKNIDTFSLISKDFPEGDESYYIKKMVETGNITPHYFVADHVNPLQDINMLTWHLEQPIPSPNMCLFWQLFKIMQSKNIRVSFSGYDGDTVLYMGQNYLKELLVKFKWTTLIQEIGGISRNRNKTSLNVVCNKLLYPLIPQEIKKIWHKTKNPKNLRDLVLENKELDKQLNLNKKFKEYDRTSINPTSARKFHYQTLCLGAHQNAFELINKHYSAFYIEPRFPYFDKRLIEFCYAIPTEQKFKFGWNRRILRTSMNNILPKEIQWRVEKKFLTPIFERNLLKFGEKYLDEIIEKNGFYSNFVDYLDLKDIYRRYKNKGDDYQIYDAWNIWELITLDSWFKQLNNK